MLEDVVLAPLPMKLDDLVKLLSVAAWPTVTIGIVSVFYTQLAALLSKLADSLSIKTIKIKLLGAEIEVTPDQADHALNEMMEEAAESLNGLSQSEIRLFEKVREARGERTLQELIPEFTRNSDSHEELRRLRDRKLIRPNEGGKWELGKRPVVTRFAEIFLKLKDQSRRTNLGE
jgi:hypothetical protein